MAIDPEARRRWRERRIGNVALGSPRGVAGVVILGLCVAAVVATPILQVIGLLSGEAPETNPSFDRRALVVNLGFNAGVLLVLPIVALAITRPGDGEGVVRRLGLVVRPMTALHAAIGVGVALASLALLALVLSALSEAGLYEAEESALIPQIQALLNWPVVISISALAAITEEVFFRGLLQPRIGLVASSLFFGFIHLGYGTALQVVAPFLLGLLFGYLFLATRSLWAPMAAHFTFDFVQLSALLLEKEGVLAS